MGCLPRNALFNIMERYNYQSQESLIVFGMVSLRKGSLFLWIDMSGDLAQLSL